MIDELVKTEILLSSSHPSYMNMSIISEVEFGEVMGRPQLGSK